MNKNSFFNSSLALAGATLAISTATPVNALTFHWSFVIGSNSSGQVGETISGTISGLVQGNNPAENVTVTVDSTPTGELTGGGWSVALPDLFFVVTGGAITAFDASYTRNGGIESLDFGRFDGTPGGTIVPLFEDTSDDLPSWEGASVTTFTLVSATTPEPGSVVALLGLGALAIAGRKLKR